MLPDEEDEMERNEGALLEPLEQNKSNLELELDTEQGVETSNSDENVVPMKTEIKKETEEVLTTSEESETTNILDNKTDVTENVDELEMKEGDDDKSSNENKMDTELQNNLNPQNTNDEYKPETNDKINTKMETNEKKAKVKVKGNTTEDDKNGGSNTNQAMNKSKKRARSQENSSANNAITNTLITNLQSILLELSNQQYSANGAGAYTAIPFLNAFSTSSSSSSTNNSSSCKHVPTLPKIQQVTQNTIKSIHDSPPWVHLSQRDSAPQLKINDSLNFGKRLSVKGGGGSGGWGGSSSGCNATGTSHNNTGNGSSNSGNSSGGSQGNSSGGGDSVMRGYRMVRGSHGVSEGTAFFEVFIYAPPSGHEMVSNLPIHVRLGEALQDQLKEKILYEQELERLKQQKEEAQKQQQQTSQPQQKRQKQWDSTPLDKRSKHYQKRMQMLGGHVRLGWSMRTGELQAPVGYDRWSYGVRDIMSSKIHNSRRQDTWAGGELASFGPGDIIGVAISLKPNSHGNNASANDAKNNHTTEGKKRKDLPSTTNEIRFFKNGLSLGQILASRNIRSGGAAFENIQDGTYYPAVSVFMGGNVRVNFGPHFVYPIQVSQLPTGIKKLRPMSHFCNPPKHPDEVLKWAVKEMEKVYPKGKGCNVNAIAEDLEAIATSFKEAVKTNATIMFESFENHVKSHIEEIKKARQDRGLSSNLT